MTLRVGVIGVGHLGRHHARILSSLPGARLVAVVDKIGGRAAEIATVNRTEASTDYRDLLGEVSRRPDASSKHNPPTTPRKASTPRPTATLSALLRSRFVGTYGLAWTVTRGGFEVRLTPAGEEGTDLEAHAWVAGSGALSWIARNAH